MLKRTKSAPLFISRSTKNDVTDQLHQRQAVPNTSLDPEENRFLNWIFPKSPFYILCHLTAIFFLFHSLFHSCAIFLIPFMSFFVTILPKNLAAPASPQSPHKPQRCQCAPLPLAQQPHCPLLPLCLSSAGSTPPRSSGDRFLPVIQGATGVSEPQKS